MAKTFTTIAEFKRILQLGDKLKCIYHMDFNGRDAEQQVIYKDKELGVREVSIKQTNSFALKTWREDKQEFVDSWCSYPTAKFARVDNGKLIIFERDGRKFKGGLADESNPEYAALPLVPVLTYEFVD